MAITATIKNNFGVNFHAYDRAGQQIWTNPYVNRPPFIPSTDSTLIESCQKVAELANPAEGSVFLLDPVVKIVLASLDLKTLTEMPQVCKSLYIAIKSDSIWAAQFRQFFSKVQPLTKSPFSTEEQFKIYFRAMNDAKKPYKAQLEKNNEILAKLDMDLARARWSYGIIATEGLSMMLQRLSNQPDTDKVVEALCAGDMIPAEAKRCLQIGWDWIKIEREKYYLGGDDFDGKIAISPHNQQSLCQSAIKTWICEAFNDQENFIEKMQAAVDAKNNPPKSVETLEPKAVDDLRSVLE